PHLVLIQTCTEPLVPCSRYILFFFHDPPTSEIYTLSLHDALPIYRAVTPTPPIQSQRGRGSSGPGGARPGAGDARPGPAADGRRGCAGAAGIHPGACQTRP